MAGPNFLARTTHVLKLCGHRPLSKTCFFTHDGSSKWHGLWGQLWWTPSTVQSSLLYKVTAISGGHKCPRNSPILTSWQSLSVGIPGQTQLCLYTGSSWLLWAATAIHGAQSYWWWLLSQAMKDRLWVHSPGSLRVEASRMSSRSFGKVPASLPSHPILPTMAGWQSNSVIANLH